MSRAQGSFSSLCRLEQTGAPSWCIVQLQFTPTPTHCRAASSAALRMSPQNRYSLAPHALKRVRDPINCGVEPSACATETYIEWISRIITTPPSGTPLPASCKMSCCSAWLSRDLAPRVDLPQSTRSPREGGVTVCACCNARKCFSWFGQQVPRSAQPFFSNAASSILLLDEQDKGLKRSDIRPFSPTFFQ
ncbi:hypothetical protein LX36DRAFT_651756 [Colletotrichum falcatum]|nr:hypothetical protein LX36DRAFT_651756 [Colletotrichum falcatum]